MQICLIHKEPATSVSGNIINLQLSPDSESFPVTRSKQQASVFKLPHYLRPQSVQGYFSYGKSCWKSIIWWIKPEWNQSIQKRSGYNQAQAVTSKLFVLLLFRRRSVCTAKSHFSNITFAIELKSSRFAFSMNEQRLFKWRDVVKNTDEEKIIMCSTLLQKNRRNLS